MLRTISNLVRKLLIQENMPHPFWVEALHTAVHTLNLLSSSSINNLISFTRFFHKPVSYSHLRVFGCLCYPNTLSTAFNKLAPRSMVCLFLGYPSNHREYRCLDIHTSKIIISHHVTFVEDIFPFSSLPSQPSLPLLPPLPPALSPPSVITPPTLPIAARVDSPLSPDSAPAIPSPPHVGLPPPTDKALPQLQHSMVTQSKCGITKPRIPLCLHTDTISPLPVSHV